MSLPYRAVPWRSLTLLLALAGAAPLGCEGGPHKGSAGTAGTVASAGTSGAAAGTNGMAGTGGTGGDAAGVSGMAGTTGTGGDVAGVIGTGSGGTSAAAGTGGGGVTGGVAGTSGGAGVAGGAGSSGFGGMFGGPAAYTAKPLSVVAYAPFRDGQAPGGQQPTQAQVRADLMMLKPLVDGIRVYGTDGALSYIPALCDELGIDLHIGAWIDGIASDEPNVRALAVVVNQNHPSIKTAIIGNEVLARSAKNLVTEARLIELINIGKTAITNKTVKIAAADTYPQWMMMRPNLAASVDLLIWHTYGWWSGAEVTSAYALVNSRYNDMLAAYPGKPMLLGETGWPSQVDKVSADMTTTAVGNEANQARFYRDAYKGFRARNLPMWMFSSIDEKWKGTSGEGEVGAHWGIFTSARQPKAYALEIMMK